MTDRCRLATTPAPIIETPVAPPPLPVSLYRQRIDRAVERARSSNLDVLAIYADREHFANLAYLTGVDPRFEEALLLLGTDGKSLLLLGNECMGYAPDPALNVPIELFQEFSLLGQPRQRSRPLRDILTGFGIRAGVRVGAVGWKYFDGALVTAGALDVPSYLADLLRDLAGASHVSNATAIFMHAQHGLRTINEPEQIAHFEYASAVTASSVLNVLRALPSALTQGHTEADLERQYDTRGLPLSCHRMINTGDKVARGLSSPSPRVIRRNEPFCAALGVYGSLTCRAGWIAQGPEELPATVRDFYPALAANYFHVIATWYETVRVGVTAGEVFAAVESVRNAKLYSLAVNPGHQIHLDEWLNAPFQSGDTTPLASGNALQMDIIPVSTGPFCYANAEDGILLADATLRSQLRQHDSALWTRMQARRARVQSFLGIQLDESVLPLGDLTGWLPPYLLDLSRAFVRA